jgi:hypothetical protein
VTTADLRFSFHYRLQAESKYLVLTIIRGAGATSKRDSELAPSNQYLKEPLKNCVSMMDKGTIPRQVRVKYFSNIFL